MRNLTLLLFLSFLMLDCQTPEKYDLIIKNASVLNIQSGAVNEGQTICINEDQIISIVSSSQSVTGDSIIDAADKLVTPSFIDTHVHPISEFADGDYSMVPDTLPIDSLNDYRQLLTDAFLPQGVTTILMMGHPDGWTDSFLEWTKQSKADQIDVFTCGGALATEDGNPYKGHLRLKDSLEARDRILDYYDRGIRHLKLYWRLQEPEFKAVLETSDSLGMINFGHVGGFLDPSQINIFQTLELGLKNYEHIAILPCNVFDDKDWEQFQVQYQNHFGNVEGKDAVIIYILETFRYADEHRKDEFLSLIAAMSEKDCSISTTIGWLYKAYHPTFFSEPQISELSKEQFQRCEENYQILMDYTKRLHEAAIEIRIGTDTKDGGKLLLQEIRLLAEYGMPVVESLKIASFNGAKAMGIEEDLGSIEEGKKANLLIWNQNPLENSAHLFSEKTIIKDGILYRP